LMTLKYIWRSFQPRMSFPRPFQQPLACFRVARSPSNSWASCKSSDANPMKMSDTGGIPTEPNCPQNSETGISVAAVHFLLKNDFGGLGRFFHVVSFTHNLSSNMIGSKIQQSKYFFHAVSLHFYKLVLCYSKHSKKNSDKTSRYGDGSSRIAQISLPWQQW